MQAKKPLAASFCLCMVLWTLGPSAQEKPADQATAADGKSFRILDRAVKEINRDVVFSGRIPAEVAVNKNPDGELALCINCPAGPPAAEPPKDQAAASTAGARPKAPLGVVLALDLTSQWNPRFYGGRFLYTNDSGYDEDDRDYELYPLAGHDTKSCLVGKLLFLTGGPPSSPVPKDHGALPFQLVLKRWSTLYAAPVAGSQAPPRKVTEPDAGYQEMKEALKDQYEKEPAWGAALKPAWTFKGGATTDALLEAVSLFASDGEQFLLVLDLRGLESKEATYFWAPFDKYQSIHLDRHVLSVLGTAGQEGEESYQPTSFVEYPYLVVVGEYAKLALTTPAGKPEVTLVLGSCPGCP